MIRVIGMNIYDHQDGHMTSTVITGTQVGKQVLVYSDTNVTFRITSVDVSTEMVGAPKYMLVAKTNTSCVVNGSVKQKTDGNWALFDENGVEVSFEVEKMTTHAVAEPSTTTSLPKTMEVAWKSGETNEEV